MRKDPALDPPPAIRKSVERHTETRKYSLLTPMFGGGAVTKQADEELVIRGSSIRGHLRFWWRATRGFALGSLEEMRRRENEIFGSTDQPSALRIALEIENPGTRIEAFKWDSVTKDPTFQEALGYGSFPLRPEKGKPAIRCDLLGNVVFQLKVDLPSQLQPELEVALSAWELFGGIGGRTRRGFGAVSPAGARSLEAIENLRKALPQSANALSGVPFLDLRTGPWKVSQTSFKSAMEAWLSTLNRYREFRQLKSKGKTGKSLWPEADAIRGLNGNKVASGAPYPRAFLGLPIVLHFKGERPEVAQISGAKHERRASPIAFRPIEVAPNQFKSLVYTIHPIGLPPGGIKIDCEAKTWRFSQKEIQESDIYRTFKGHHEFKYDPFTETVNFLEGKRK